MEALIGSNTTRVRLILIRAWGRKGKVGLTYWKGNDGLCMLFSKYTWNDSFGQDSCSPSLFEMIVGLFGSFGPVVRKVGDHLRGALKFTRQFLCLT